MAVTEDTLRQLQPGDVIYYHGVEWRVRDVSHYRDRNGYETEEWLLKSPLSKEYYLLREVDPENPTSEVNWYIAEQLKTPAIYEPGNSRDLLTSLASDMRSRQYPYPELQTLNRVYLFESETEGTYDSEEGSERRITWDYWDSTHLWNLALEAWSDSSLAIYSTRKVTPADFSRPQMLSVKGDDPANQGWAGFEAAQQSSMGGFQRSRPRDSLFGVFNVTRKQQFVMAFMLVILGLILFASGI